ncbi:MAG: hypothetical protein K8F24_11320 [Bacteroidales bacterium]|nr:hypothetical protein [Bacteroidales bacterium]
MKVINRSRVIRPSSRGENSESYKIDTKKVTAEDTLIVNISHEATAFQKSFKFNGKDLANKNSIHFKAVEEGSQTKIEWSGAKPI